MKSHTIKIDLHVHSSERSNCAVATAEEQVRAAVAAGLDAIVFTDHHRLVDANQLNDLNARYAPFRIFGGIEITAQGEDFILCGLNDAALENRAWDYADLWQFVQQKNGFLALAHPFRYHQQIAADIARFPPHAIEICSTNTPPRAAPEIQEIAASLKISLLCNSDAHAPERLGSYYNIFDELPPDDASLAAALKAGRFQCGSGFKNIGVKNTA